MRKRETVSLTGVVFCFSMLYYNTRLDVTNSKELIIHLQIGNIIIERNLKMVT